MKFCFLFLALVTQFSSSAHARGSQGTITCLPTYLDTDKNSIPPLKFLDKQYQIQSLPGSSDIYTSNKDKSQGLVLKIELDKLNHRGIASSSVTLTSPEFRAKKREFEGYINFDYRYAYDTHSDIVAVEITSSVTRNDQRVVADHQYWNLSESKMPTLNLAIPADAQASTGLVSVSLDCSIDGRRL